MKKIFLLIFLLSIFSLNAQNVKTYLYKGVVDSRPVTLFVTSSYNECIADLSYMGMYKYDKISNWLQLDITTNGKNHFIMVEYGFSGVMILKKDKNSFSGIWISPDTKKQLRVELKEQVLSPKQSKELEDKLENVNYENYDC